MDLGELGLDDLTLEENGQEDMNLDELGLNDLEMDDMALEEHGLEDMSLEEDVQSDLDDLGLDDLSINDGETEDEFSEFSDLLGNSDGNDEIDDEMLALLESVSDSEDDGILESGEENFDLLQGGDEVDEDRGADLAELMSGDNENQEEPQDEGKKKKKRKWGRKKSKDENEDLKGNDASEEGAKEETDKKPGAFARFLAFLTESEEDDEESAASSGEGSDENGDLLGELGEGGKKNKKDKKDKKDKKKKGKKGAAEGEEGADGDSKGTKKKPKNEKKPKKEKAVDEEASNEPPSKKLSKKKIIPVILFCITITVVIILLTSVLPTYLEKRDAHVAYDMGNYSQVYDLLYGKDLSEDDEALLQKLAEVLEQNPQLEYAGAVCVMSVRAEVGKNRVLQELPDEPEMEVYVFSEPESIVLVYFQFNRQASAIKS